MKKKMYAILNNSGVECLEGIMHPNNIRERCMTPSEIQNIADDGARYRLRGLWFNQEHIKIVTKELNPEYWF